MSCRRASFRAAPVTTVASRTTPASEEPRTATALRRAPPTGNARPERPTVAASREIARTRGECGHRGEGVQGDRERDREDRAPEECLDCSRHAEDPLGKDHAKGDRG